MEERGEEHITGRGMQQLLGSDLPPMTTRKTSLNKDTKLMHGVPQLIPLGLCVLAVWLGGLQGAAPGQEPTWKAGIARTIITPKTGVWLAGYGTKRPPECKLHDLWMKALALEDPQGNRG